MVWSKQRNGQRVDANGSLIGSHFQITSDDQAIEYKPSLAYNPIRHRYLVTGQNHHQQLFGQWMNGDGTLDGNSITLSDQVNGEYSASACVDTVSGQTLVTWGDDRNSEDSDIYAARILPNGELAPQGDFAISIVDEDQKNPAVGCSSALHQFLVVYDDGRDTSRQRIFAQRVSWWGMLLGAEFAVGVPNLAAFDPSIAFDEREIRYLVVWSDDRNGDSDIFGQLFDRDGLPIEDNFTIYQGAGEQTRPDIAYNAASSSYLVAWEDQPNRSVVGQLVSAQGSLQYSPLTISSSVYTGTNPAVASNPEAAYNNFLVVFRQDVDRTSQNDVEARIVNPDGTLAASSTHVSSLIGEQGLPDVIYNPTSHEYLVAFQDKSSGVYQITGQILSPVNQLVGGKIPISTGATMYEQAPAVVYNPDDNQYLVVWHRDNVATGEDIYGQLLAAGGSFPIGETNFKISTVTGDNQQIFPAAIYFAAMNRYAVIWGDNRDPTTQWDLRGQWLSNTGDVLGLFDLPIFRDLGVQSNPAIVYAPGYDQALTVWYENTLPGIFGIHGRFGALDTTPPKARFTIDPGAGFSGETFAFNAWPSRDDLTPPGMLLVRWDLNNDGAWDTSLGHDKYITMTVFAQGIHTVTLEVWNLAWMTDTLKRRFDVIPPPLKPDANPDQPTTPSANLTITPTLGTAGSLFKFDGRESSGFWLLGVRWDFENDGRFETGLSNVLTSTHVYTQAGDYTARLELWDLDQTGRSAIANLTVLPATFTSLEASPSELRVIPKEAVLLRSVAGDVYGNGVFNPAGSTWSMLNPAAGSVDASGKFTASQQAGTYPDAIQVSLGGLTDRITVTIYWPYQVRLPLVRK